MQISIYLRSQIPRFQQKYKCVKNCNKGRASHLKHVDLYRSSRRTHNTAKARVLNEFGFEYRVESSELKQGALTCHHPPHWRRFRSGQIYTNPPLQGMIRWEKNLCHCCLVWSLSKGIIRSWPVSEQTSQLRTLGHTRKISLRSRSKWQFNCQGKPILGTGRESPRSSCFQWITQNKPPTPCGYGYLALGPACFCRAPVPGYLSLSLEPFFTALWANFNREFYRIWSKSAILHKSKMAEILGIGHVTSWRGSVATTAFWHGQL